MVDVGLEPTIEEKNMVLPTTPFVEVLLVGYFSPFDHLQKVNQ